jgi:hypothetical protein
MSDADLKCAAEAWNRERDAIRETLIQEGLGHTPVASVRHAFMAGYVAALIAQRSRFDA